MKKLIGILLALCLLMAVCFTAQAASPLLTDEAGLLSSSEAAALEQKLTQISTRQGMDIVIVTVESTDGEDPEAFADDWFDYSDYRADGILLLVCMEEGQWHISTAGYGITAITDAGLEYIGNCFVPELSEGNFTKAFDIFARLCDEFITQAKTGDPYDSHNLPKEPFNVVLSVFIAIFAAIIVASVGGGILKGQLKSVRAKTEAADYMKPGSLQLTEARDFFLYRHIDRREKPKNNGGSSTHTSSSGNTHGGSSRSF